MELEAGDKSKAAARLCSAYAGNPSLAAEEAYLAPTDLIRATQALLSVRDYSIISGDVTQCASHAESLALLQYLTAKSSTEPMAESQGNISAAMVSIWDSSEMIISRNSKHSNAHERLLQSAARLLYFHANRG
jgi:hypothetical protein